MRESSPGPTDNRAARQPPWQGVPWVKLLEPRCAVWRCIRGARRFAFRIARRRSTIQGPHRGGQASLDRPANWPSRHAGTSAQPCQCDRPWSIIILTSPAARLSRRRPLSRHFVPVTSPAPVSTSSTVSRSLPITPSDRSTTSSSPRTWATSPSTSFGPRWQRMAEDVAAYLAGVPIRVVTDLADCPPMAAQ